MNLEQMPIRERDTMKCPKGPPPSLWLCVDTGLLLSKTSVARAVRWDRTSHRWARKNPDDVLWLSPYCGVSCCTRFSDAMIAKAGNPFGPCDIWARSKGTWECNRGATPYRKGTETA